MSNPYLDSELLRLLMVAVKSELEQFNFPDEDRPKLYETYNKILEIKKKEFNQE
jgi:hypothetical protein